jgi:hypothetical protein
MLNQICCRRAGGNWICGIRDQEKIQGERGHKGACYRERFLCGDSRSILGVPQIYSETNHRRPTPLSEGTSRTLIRSIRSVVTLCVRKDKHQQANLHFRLLTAHLIDFIVHADTFMIATMTENHLGDASHRGGRPGFIRVVDRRRLLWGVSPILALLFLYFYFTYTFNQTTGLRRPWTLSDPG